jgi:hypothetical protein
MITYAVDFESYYDKECSITTLGPRGYFSHPLFDAYLVSVVGDDGYEFCGNPRDFDWTMLNGNVVLSHNASFDESLFLFGVEKGWWPACQPAFWYCTADMAAYCGLPRALKNALAAVFDIEMSKTTRDNMCGKQWSSMTPEFQAEVIEYAIKDSVLCLKLWQELEHKWPEMERKISAVNRKALQRGIPIDQQYLKTCLEEIQLRLHEAEQRVPWIGSAPILSRPSFDAECRKVGIEPPKSLALDNEEANEWIRIHGVKYTWVAAIRDYRRINALKRKLEAFDNATMSDGRYYGGLMYFGANATGRFSGSGGNLNLQNLPREEQFGVDLRRLFKTKPGKKFVVVDLSQIEVRTLCWLAGDADTLKLIEEHDDIYEAFALKYGVWTKEQGSLKENGGSLRTKLVKPTTLGCGYQAGPERLAEASNMELEVAENAVRTYRQSMPKVVNYWRHLQTHLGNCHTQQKPLSLGLPSGRVQRYGDIKMRRVVRTILAEQPDGTSELRTVTRREYFATLLKNGRQVPSKLYGGLLCLAGDTLVLTERRGWVRLDKVSPTDRVFDGFHFVNHGGVVFRGFKFTDSFSGVRMTPDHRVLSSTGWGRADQTNYEDAKKCCRIIGEGFWDSDCAPQAPNKQWGRQAPMGVPVRVREHHTAGGDPSLPGITRSGGEGLVLESVYDITSAGPLNRFVVLCDDEQPIIVHNCENLSQALARDIFAEGLVRIEEAGYPVLFHVHDEVIVEVDDEVADKALADIVGIFAKPPTWIPDIPLASEGHIMDVYEKK